MTISMHGASVHHMVRERKGFGMREMSRRGVIRGCRVAC